MKIRLMTPLLTTSLSITSSPAAAHDSLEAMQNGGSVARMTAAFLHPLLELDYPALVLLGLLAGLLFIGSAKLWVGMVRLARDSSLLRRTPVPQRVRFAERHNQARH